MIGKTLAKEAEEFAKEKTSNYTSQDKTALRFYFGNALAGYLNDPHLRQRPNELVDYAFNLAVQALEAEKKRF